MVYVRNWFKQEAENFYFNEEGNVKEQLRRNITNEFFATLARMVELKEIIVGNINGKPGDGKSVLIATICHLIQTKLLKKEWNAKCIDRDEQEFVEWVKKNHNARDEMRMIDEHSSLYEVGENSTTERAFFTEYSDLFRSNYIHRWYCSPTSEIDKNVVIILEVASTDKKVKTTQAYVFYNLFLNGIPNKVPIGYIDVSVANTLEAEWYTDYERRKDDRQKLILKYGFTSIREMYYAELSKAIFDEMQIDATTKCKIDRDRVLSVVKPIVREKKMMLSMVGIESRIAEPKSALNMLQEINLRKKRINYLKDKKLKKPKDFTFKDEMDLEDDILLISVESQRLNKVLDHWNDAIKLKKELMELE